MALADYWDRVLIELLQFRFPVNLNRNKPLLVKKHVSLHLQQEMGFIAIIGPFDKAPIILAMRYFCQ